VSVCWRAADASSAAAVAEPPPPAANQHHGIMALTMSTDNREYFIPDVRRRHSRVKNGDFKQENNRTINSSTFLLLLTDIIR